MQTRSIVALSLSPVGLLLLYGLGDIVNGASEPAVATSTPEAEVNQVQSKTQSAAQSSHPSHAVQPTPGSAEAKSQPEFSTARVLPQQPALQPASQPLPHLPALATPASKFELATIRVDATKLDRVIHQSFRSDTAFQTRFHPVAAAPAGLTASSAAPTPATPAAMPTASETLQPHTEFTPTITPPETSQLDAIQFIASSGAAVSATFQLSSGHLTESTDRPPASALFGTALSGTALSGTALSTSALTVSSLSRTLQPASSAVNLNAPSESQSPEQLQSPKQEPSQASVIAQIPAAPAATTSVSGSLTSTNEAYILGTGDIIQTNFFNVPEYNGQLQVMPDGTVNLPVVGSVAVSGMTLKQASDAIGARYASELNYSTVSVYLVQPRPLQIALVGEITQPGLYSIPANQNGQFPAVVQAIQTAGGATQSANLQQVEIRRKDQTGTVRTMTVNLLALLQQGDLNQNSLLQDGDVIFIPAAAEVNLADANQLAISNLRSSTTTPLDVSVVGEVSRPGPYRMEGAEGRSTLVQAIQQAGGFTPSADLSQIQLRRKTHQGTEQVVNIDLWRVLQTGDLEQDLVLQQGDTVVIPTARELTTAETAALTASSLSTGTIQVNIIGEVESPGAQQLQANTNLNQAVLAAGGFNGRARGEVKLIRFNPNGTLTQQQIDVDLTQELNSETNPILHSNDVIVVGRSTGARIRDGLSDVMGIFQLISPLIPF